MSLNIIHSRSQDAQSLRRNYFEVPRFCLPPIAAKWFDKVMAKLDQHQMKMRLAEEKPKAGLLECGVDEVGIGSAIAEVYAAACILDPARRINGLRDSKQLTPERRKQLSDRIRERAFDYCIATASLEEVNQFNVFGATMLAMVRAVEGLKLKPDMVLIDGNRMPKLSLPARTIVKGDAKVRHFGRLVSWPKLPETRPCSNTTSNFPIMVLPRIRAISQSSTWLLSSSSVPARFIANITHQYARSLKEANRRK